MITSRQGLVQSYVPKFKLAKVSGFEGIKNLNMKISREFLNGDTINLQDYFSDELVQRTKDQSDLLIDICKADFKVAESENPYGGKGFYNQPSITQKFTSLKNEERKARQNSIR